MFHFILLSINTFQFPTALPVGFTLPSNWATYVGSFPTQTFNPSLILPASFNNIVGYSANFTTDPNLNNAYVPPAGSQFISKNGSGTLSYISTQAPNVQPNSSIYISVSNINNNYSQPSSIIYAVVPTVLPGELVVERPPQFMSPPTIYPVRSGLSSPTTCAWAVRRWMILKPAAML
jgi:hypothetical protein